MIKDLWDQGLIGVYHRSCYQSYTNKTNLDRLVRKRQAQQVQPQSSNEPDVSSEPLPKYKTHQSLPTFEPLKTKGCIICRSIKYQRDKKNIAPLSQCLTVEAGEALRKAATIRDDQRVLMELADNDPIAKEVRYHRYCYQRYTLKRNLKALSLKRKETKSAYDVAFEYISEIVQDKIISELDVIKMSELRDIYVNQLQASGVTDPSFKTQRLKQRLQRHFGDMLSFWQPTLKCESEIVYSENVKKGQIVEAGINCLDKASSADARDSQKTSNNEEHDIVTLYHSAKVLRCSLHELTAKLPQVPSAKDLHESSIQVPDSLFNFLAWLLCDSTDVDGDIPDVVGRINVRNDMKRRILSIGQDLVYASPNGRVKTPKHVSIAMTVKNLTRSSQVITLLNRFGHCISYNDVISLENKMVQQQLQREKDNLILPSNIQPHVFANFCWDNNDLNEETVSGSDTTHCINAIIIQQRVHTCEPPPPYTKPNTVPDLSLSDLGQVLPYSYTERGKPGYFKINLTEMKRSSDIHDEVMALDFVWCLLRMPIGETLFDISGQISNVPGK